MNIKQCLNASLALSEKNNSYPDVVSSQNFYKLNKNVER